MSVLCSLCVAIVRRVGLCVVHLPCIQGNVMTACMYPHATYTRRFLLAVCALFHAAPTCGCARVCHGAAQPQAQSAFGCVTADGGARRGSQVTVSQPQRRRSIHGTANLISTRSRGHKRHHKRARPTESAVRAQRGAHEITISRIGFSFPPAQDAEAEKVGKDRRGMHTSTTSASDRADVQPRWVGGQPTAAKR